MKLITELNWDEVRHLSEGEGPSRKLFIEGVFLQGAVKNRNGRVYPMGVLDPEASRYIREAVALGSGWGELSHPQGPQINPDRVSHRITSLVKEGNNYVGKAIIVNNEKGHIVKGLLESGGRVGVSSRGMGSLKDVGGIMEVQSDFRIATAADVVLDPSAPDAFIRGIMEGVEWHMTPEGTWTQEVVHETRKEVSQLSMRQIEEQKVSRFKAFAAKLVRGKRD